MNNFRIKFTNEISVSKGVPFDTDIIVQLIKNKTDNNSVEVVIRKGLTYNDINAKINEISIKLNEDSDEKYSFSRDNICFGESINKKILTSNDKLTSEDIVQTIIFVDYYLSILETSIRK